MVKGRDMKGSKLESLKEHNTSYNMIYVIKVNKC